MARTRKDGALAEQLPWPFRDGKMFLIPGDSALGYRLPLASLPWQAPDERESDVERDPFDERKPLTAKKPRRRKSQSSREIYHTALCVEPRDGQLHVFLPPLTHLEHFIDLMRSIEAAVEELDFAVVFEGYEPPSDPRLKLFQVTPDPGVIEVNIHPAADWRTLVDNTETLYERARECRLGAEKFMLDGRHTGTGGGNHVTLGAPAPKDSPFLNHPEILASLISYWQNHPSLSYLFSGLFIGPTSQSPRVDEARDDNLYELEIALAELRAKEKTGAMVCRPRTAQLPGRPHG